MKLILTRHGETEENLKGILQGQTDTQLTELGIRQAQDVAQALKAENIDIVYTSDLIRAKYTADELFKLSNVKVVCTEDLRERKFGDIEGQAMDVYLDALKSSGQSFYEYRAPKGENLIDVTRRVKSLWNEIKTKHMNDNVLISTHGGPASMLIKILLNKSYDECKKFELDNGCICILDVKNSGKVEYLTKNSIEHLRNTTENLLKFSC